MTALADQIKFMEKEVSTREEAYPVRVSMGRITQKEEDKNLRQLRAILESLKQSDGKAAAATALDVKTTALPAEIPTPKATATDTPIKPDKFSKIFPVLEQVRKCAHQRRAQCHGCQAIDDVLEEAMKLL